MMGTVCPEGWAGVGSECQVHPSTFHLPLPLEGMGRKETYVVSFSEVRRFCRCVSAFLLTSHNKTSVQEIV